jgi:hypothetical protein
MAAAIELRPELLLAAHLPSRWVWPLHLAAPTTRGWQLLAGHVLHAGHVIEVAAFGSELDVALETLDRALGEERRSAERLTLARWLAEIGGTP